MPRGIPKAGKRKVTTNAGHFKGKDDPRQNHAGQRNKAAVSFTKQLRELIVECGEADITVKGATRKRIEWTVQAIYNQAMKGNVQAFNALIERVEGKITQPIANDPDNPFPPTSFQFIPYVKPDTDSSKTD